METASAPNLTNAQKELMQLFSIELSQNEMKELRNKMAQIYARRATVLANEEWDKRKLSQTDMKKWLNGDFSKTGD